MATTFTSLKPCDLSRCTKSELRDYFVNSFDLNDSLFTALNDDSVFYKCPDRLRLPLIFYYGHTASVYINKLILAGLLQPEDRPNLYYETLMETGVDEQSWDDTDNFRMGGKFKWPTVTEVKGYRIAVKNLILKVIEETPLELPITMESPWWALMMGMEHDRIHLETSSVLIRQLPVDMVTKPSAWKYAPAVHGNGAGKNTMIRVGASEVTLGKPEDFPSYGWDNEYGQCKCNVPAFEASKYLITNKEFLEFVDAGGYTSKSYWSEEGWDWCKFRKAKHPTFWVCPDACKSGCGGDLTEYSHCICNHCKPVTHLPNGSNAYCNGHDTVDANGHQGKDEGGGNSSDYMLRVMFDVVAMPWDWPVEVNYHEAKAYCAWKGTDYRLPSEAEHNVMRGPQPPVSDGVSCDIIYQDKINANLNFQFGSSTPVNMFPPTERGFHDVFGNVWHWTEDHFNGLPGYSSHSLYDDFSSPCFDGRHNNILGGSWISTGDEASRFARYAFRRHFFQHAGFRVVRSIADADSLVISPTRLVNTEVFVPGVGVIENTVTLPKNIQPEILPSTNLQLQYESEVALNDMLRFEYGVGQDLAVNLTERCGQMLTDYGIPLDSALHIGCGTGKVTFGLTKYFKQVLGQDYGGRFIDACLNLQKDGSLSYLDYIGFKRKEMKAKVDSALDRSKVIFKQLTWLPNEVEFHDFILVTMLDRTLNAKAWLLRLPEVLRKGGLLVVASTDWDDEALMANIGQRFTLVNKETVPFNDSMEERVVIITAWQHK